MPNAEMPNLSYLWLLKSQLVRAPSTTSRKFAGEISNNLECTQVRYGRNNGVTQSDPIDQTND